MNKIVEEAIKNGNAFYTNFASRFFGALIGEMTLSELEKENSMELKEIVKLAQEMFEKSKKAEAPDKATA
ncbi:hypothetical protein [Bacillus benzoevorans]|uniref:hypothetical protein n=1 Tax=Bacillus benzoevorans TaxID=1456 RepID=UPI0036731900